MYYVAGCRDTDITGNLLAFFTGLAAGLCAMVVDNIILMIIPTDLSSFWLKYLVVFLIETGIPFFGGIIALYFILEAPVKQRISNIRPQLFGISTIILPYILLSFYNVPDMWPIILLPMIMVSILFLADFFIGRLLPFISRSIDIIDLLYALAPVILAMILTDACKTLWYFAMLPWLFIILSFIIIISAFFLRLIKYRT